MKLRRGKNLRRSCRITKRGVKQVHCNIWSCSLPGLLQLQSLWLIRDKLKYQCDLDGELPKQSVTITYFCGSPYRDKPQVLFHGQESFHILLLFPIAAQTNCPFPFGFQLSPCYVRMIWWLVEDVLSTHSSIVTWFCMNHLRVGP